MKIIVLGATGQTGQQLVRQALEHGHSVRAVVRDPSKLPMAHDRLEVRVADMLDREAMFTALEGSADAVVSPLGFYHRYPCTDLSDGTRNIVAAMQHHGIERIVVITTLGVGDSRGQGSFIARAIQKWSLLHVIDDKDRQEQVVRDSDLDWTFVRPPQLTNKERVRRDLVVWQGPSPTSPKLSWKISRAGLAAFVLDIVEQGTYSRMALTISEPK
ncbi:MAG: SDR family oxidoreductase [Gammaproteobacteria bacterium]|nr:SDR family oxidoreductase [Gammaproteobacteria bacterium]